MAEFVLDNAYFSVGKTTVDATNYMSYTRSVTINFTAAEQDKTVMGDAAMARLIGLKDCTIDVEFVQDFDAGGLDQNMYNYFNGASPTENVIIALAPESGTEGASNPLYTGTFLCTAYSPISGSVGDTSGASANFVLSSGTMVSRDVA